MQHQQMQNQQNMMAMIMMSMMGRNASNDGILNMMASGLSDVSSEQHTEGQGGSSNDNQTGE